LQITTALLNLSQGQASKLFNKQTMEMTTHKPPRSIDTATSVVKADDHFEEGSLIWRKSTHVDDGRERRKRAVCSDGGGTVWETCER
jgi:hypothetical protein